MSTPFKNGADPEELAYWHEYYREKYCRNVISWKIKKGDYITEQTKISSELSVIWFVGTEKRGTVELYASSTNTPSKYLSSGKFPRHYGIISRVLMLTGDDHIGNVSYDFEDLDMSMFETKLVKKRRAYRVDLTLEVYLGHQQGTLAFKLLSQGEEVGNATLSFSQLEGITGSMSKLSF